MLQYRLGAYCSIEWNNPRTRSGVVLTDLGGCEIGPAVMVALCVHRLSLRDKGSYSVHEQFEKAGIREREGQYLN